MIRSFECEDTYRLFTGRKSRRWGNLRAVALRKLDQLDAAQFLADLASPPANRLEALRGLRRGQHSIRINEQWRLCFRWKSDGAYEVEIVDYH